MGDMFTVTSIKHHVCYNPEITIVVTPKEHAGVHKKGTLYDKEAIVDLVYRWHELSEAIRKSYVNDGVDAFSSAKRDLMYKSIYRIKEFELPKLLPREFEITKICLINGEVRFNAI